jgi:hypothetical protein
MERGPIRNDINLWVRRGKEPGEIITYIWNEHAVDLDIMDVRWHIEEKHAFRKSARSKLQVRQDPIPGLPIHPPTMKNAKAMAAGSRSAKGLSGKLKFSERLDYAIQEMEDVVRMTLARFRAGEVNEKVITNVLKTFNDMVLKSGKFEQSIRSEPAVNKTYITMQTLNILRKNDVELANRVGKALGWDPGKSAELSQNDLSYGPEERALLDAHHRGKMFVERRAPGEILAATPNAFEIIPVSDLKPEDLEET